MLALTKQAILSVEKFVILLVRHDQLIYYYKILVAPFQIRFNARISTRTLL